MTSEYVTRPLRSIEEAAKAKKLLLAQRRALGICDCGRAMKSKETEVCQHCYLDAQAGIEDAQASGA